MIAVTVVLLLVLGGFSVVVAHCLTDRIERLERRLNAIEQVDLVELHHLAHPRTNFAEVMDRSLNQHSVVKGLKARIAKLEERT